MKTCTKCNEKKDLSEYHKKGRGRKGLREACKTCVRKQNKEYNRRNSDRLGIYNKIWASENREKTREYALKYRNKNLVLCRLRWHEYDIGEKNSEVDVEFIKLLLERQSKKCNYCEINIGNTFNIDHKDPKFRGGSHARDNIQLLCATCNHKKGKKTHEEYIITTHNHE